MRNYYYLVAGLPDLALFEGKNAPAFHDAVAEIEESVHPDDCGLVSLIRLPFDNANLITLLNGRIRAFDARGNYSHDELSAGIKSPDLLPAYMQQFLQTRREERAVPSTVSDEDELNTLLYEEVIQEQQGFIADWFSFELDLRNILTALNNRRDPNYLNGPGTDRDLSLPAVLIGRNDVTEALLRSSAVDFGLSGKVEWIERVVAAADDDVLARERALDVLRWETLENMTEMSYFSMDVVLAFLLKLLLVERWKTLDAQMGRAKLDGMVKHLTVTAAEPQAPRA